MIPFLKNIKFADMIEERRESVIGCERNVMVMTLLQLSYLVHNFDKITLLTETDII